jgi:GAF domain-containing protein
VQPIPESREAMAERDAALGDDDLLEKLSAIGTQVRELVPDCFGMSVALVEDDVVLTLVATDAEIAVLDAMQYLFDGPCVEAVRGERVVELNGDEVLDEEEWRIFALASAASSVASTLTLPILVDGRVSGSVNLYAGSGHAFTGLHDELADLLGAWAPGAVANADLSFSTRRMAEDAPRRLRERARFDTAVGLLAARGALSLDEARRRLVGAAERAGVALSRVVQAVITFYAGPRS